MAFLSTKIVPTTTGCIGSGTPNKQLLFPSLEAIMRMGWKTSGVQISISGSFTEEVNGYTRTWDDSGSGTSVLSSQPMSNFICNGRPNAGFGTSLDFKYTSTDPNDPSGSASVPVFLQMSFGQALRSGSSFFFQGSEAGLDIASTISEGDSAGTVFIDGASVATLFVNADLEITITRPYTITFTTIQENIPS